LLTTPWSQELNVFATEETVLAPAKVNLFLRVIGRRRDGYHLLDSLVVPVGLYDEICVQVQPGDAADCGTTVICESPHVALGEQNLAHRAARLFLMTAAPACRCSVNIRIAKGIPVGSGLGGGSSDAAAVLLSLNRLLGVSLTTSQLCELGLQIGADVPFFLYGRPARVGGIGENVTPCELGRVLPLVICSDSFVLSTKLVYAGLSRHSLTSGVGLSNITSFVSGRRPISEMLVNDLEAAAAEVHPGVPLLKARLVQKGALGTLMTGSGSAVFGVWPDATSAAHAAAQLRAEGLWAASVPTLNRSPALDS
jgi:4-diphosphocytidyl-2-C-methyl-D-erythritol kinase